MPTLRDRRLARALWSRRLPAGVVLFHTGASHRIEFGGGDANRWRHVEDFATVSVFENQRALPRAWLVPEAVTLRPDDILNSIRRSRLPDGRAFDPRWTALVEDDIALPIAALEPSGHVTVTALTDAHVALRVETSAPALRILSDVFYPGWEACIDGRPARIYPTDYLLRGVVVPAGEHAVTFAFRPSSFLIGLGVSLLSLIALLGVGMRGCARQAWLPSLRSGSPPWLPARGARRCDGS